MTELVFARAFLSLLDAKPNKISADHVEDPRSYPARGAYILPKQYRPLTKRQKVAPGAERSLNVTLRSLRNPPLDITLKSLPPNTSILDLKSSITTQTSIPTDKIRILHNKKPIPDSKVLKDLAMAGEQKVEFSVMVIGGAAVIKKGEEEYIPDVGKVAQGPSGVEVLGQEEFWADLRSFLMQRLRDEAEGERLSSVFRRAWDTTK